jgi:hypothetical protein
MSLSSAEKLARMQRALAYGGDTHSVGDIVELLKTDRAKLVENDGAGIVAELHRFPKLTAVHFWLLFGELKQVLALEDEVLEWGKANGATIATACGRRGWGRVSAATGWREWHPNFVKGLRHDVE